MDNSQTFQDGLESLNNDLINKRNVLNSNVVASNRLPDEQCRAMYKHGITSRIVDIKTSYALKGTLVFESKADEELYNAKLSHAVNMAAKFQLAFGRGVVVLCDKRSGSMSEPLPRDIRPEDIIIRYFSGDIVGVSSYDMDLLSPRYYKPRIYTIREYNFHYSRVVDFTYKEPVEFEKPNYRFGGISEFELIRDAIIQDGLVTRSAASMVEKGSRIYYKLKGFYETLQDGQEEVIKKRFALLEDFISAYTAGLVDVDDDVINIQSQLSHLKDVSDMSLSRVSLVTGIPVPWLVGENVKGLNSVGDNERQIMRETIRGYQHDYLLSPIGELTGKLGIQKVKFDETINVTPEERANYDKLVIDNALKLDAMGEDGASYLADKGIIQPQDILSQLFPNVGGE